TLAQPHGQRKGTGRAPGRGNRFPLELPAGAGGQPVRVRDGGLLPRSAEPYPPTCPTRPHEPRARPPPPRDPRPRTAGDRLGVAPSGPRGGFLRRPRLALRAAWRRIEHEVRVHHGLVLRLLPSRRTDVEDEVQLDHLDVRQLDGNAERCGEVPRARVT